MLEDDPMDDDFDDDLDDDLDDSLDDAADDSDDSPDEISASHWTFAKWQEGKWHFLGQFETGHGELLNVIPCEDGRFIVVSCR